jgi:hypothetical protein
VIIIRSSAIVVLHFIGLLQETDELGPHGGRTNLPGRQLHHFYRHDQDQHAYNASALARNAELGLYEQRYVGGTGVATATGMTFAVARRQAEAILADEESPSRATSSQARPS